MVGWNEEGGSVGAACDLRVAEVDRGGRRGVRIGFEFIILPCAHERPWHIFSHHHTRFLPSQSVSNAWWHAMASFSEE